jgi:LytTr DNA-binding domain
MNSLINAKPGFIERKAVLMLTTAALALAGFTVIQDFLRSQLRSSAFYFSESFIFSSFWWLFAPLLLAQYVVTRRTTSKSLFTKFLVVLLPILMHLIAFPVLVGLLSSLFLDHTYSFTQVFLYALSEQLYLVALLYLASAIVFFQQFTSGEATAQPADETESVSFIDNILVSDGVRKQKVALNEVLYISASSPYICIQLHGKKYLHHATLKSISAQLDPRQFLRIHKSTIVNINMVVSYTTRLNGDYDLMMKNNVEVRVSRNFAADFKSAFCGPAPQDATK